MLELGQPVYFTHHSFPCRPMFVQAFDERGWVRLADAREFYQIRSYVYWVNPAKLETGPPAIAKHVAWRMGARDL